MPTPSKRRAEAAVESPRSSKRSRPVATKVTEQIEETAASPSGRSKRTKATAKVVAASGDAVIAQVESMPGRSTGKAKVTVVDNEGEEVAKVAAEKGKGRIKVKSTKPEVGPAEPEVTSAITKAAEVPSEKPERKKRKANEEKEAEAMPLTERTTGLAMYIGAHVSAAGGVGNSVANAIHIGGNSFALFLKSQRKWDNPALQDEAKNLFLSQCHKHKFEAGNHVLPHGSYLVNLAQKDADKAKQAYDSFLDDLQRCEALGIRYYNFHPGNTGPNPRPEAISRIAQAINKAHKATKTVTPVLENMAAGGNVIGSAFEDLSDIISQVDDKTRIGVCIDTCHAFAAGYDLRTPDAFRGTMDTFDRIVGMKYLRALHLNDSKAPFNSRRDLHQNIGCGFLGLRAFHNVMNEKRFEGMPMVLETPIDSKDHNGKTVEDKNVWAKEIKLLESLIGTSADSDEFLRMEAELAAKGKAEMAKLQDQVDRKAEKDAKKSQGKGKGRRKKGAETDGEE